MERHLAVGLESWLVDEYGLHLPQGERTFFLEDEDTLVLAVKGGDGLSTVCTCSLEKGTVKLERMPFF